MTIPLRPVPICALLICVLGIYSVAVAAEDWRPVTPAELALKTPIVDKNADAEALFWEVRIDDSAEGDLVFNHYLRIKVFTDRGRESQSRIDLPFGRLYGSEIKIKDIAARTIKTDGSIVELKKEDVFERTIVKASGLKVKARSFAMPAVEAGCIIEYRWKEIRVNQSANYVRLQMQRDIPVQQVKYFVKPYPFPGLSFRSMTFHGPATYFKKEKEGFYSYSLADVQAVSEEARMPPEDEVKTWVLVYYSKDLNLDPDKYWADFGKQFYDDTKSLFKVSDDVRQTASTLITDAKSDDEKIQKLFEFCRTKIKNTSDDASGLTAEDRKKLKDNKSPSDTLKRLAGTGPDIDLLFAALASATGFNARIVVAPDRGDMFFDRRIPDKYFITPSNIAINVGGTWKFFNPGMNYVPFGMLRWQEEGEQVLITDPKQPIWANTPLTPPDKTRVKRSAKLKLSIDGTLDGDVQLEYTGHFAIERKEDNDASSETEREDALKEEVKAQMSTAELTNIRIENVTDHVKPFVYSYHVRVPGYAQKTGRRLFIQPAFFQYGVPALFASADRKYPIYFHYPWSEEDYVEIELPPGFALDSAESPAPLSSPGITEYKPKLSVTSDGRTLVYKRDFFFGGGGALTYPVTSYSALKDLFDLVHTQDSHTIALKLTTETKP
jgi:Domain of Unknown Function with PDB structure (DUF3857)